MSAATVDVAAPARHRGVPLPWLVGPARAEAPREWWQAPATRVQAYRRRFTVAVVLAVVLAIAGGAVRSQLGPVVMPVATASVVVQPGDTLWSVAAAHAPAGSSVPAYMVALEHVNGLDGPRLQAWQVLRLPGAR